MIGVSKTIICKKSAKSEFDDVTRDPEDWIAELELLRDSLRELGAIINNVEMMTHIISNPHTYNKIIWKGKRPQI